MSASLTESQIRSGWRGCCGRSSGPNLFCETWGCAQIVTLLELLDAERERAEAAERRAAELEQELSDANVALAAEQLVAEQQQLVETFRAWRDLAAARAALAKFGKHPPECPAWRTVYWQLPLECDCGLAAALATENAPQRTPAGAQTPPGPDDEEPGVEVPA